MMQRRILQLIKNSEKTFLFPEGVLQSKLIRPTGHSHFHLLFE